MAGKDVDRAARMVDTIGFPGARYSASKITKLATSRLGHQHNQPACQNSQRTAQPARPRPSAQGENR